MEVDFFFYLLIVEKIYDDITSVFTLNLTRIFLTLIECKGLIVSVVQEKN